MTISQDRRKVLFLVESLGGGGAEKVLATIIEHSNEIKCDFTVCSLVNTGVYVDKIASSVNYKAIIKNPNTFWGKILYKLIYSVLSPFVIYLLFIPKNNDVEIAFVEGFSTKVLSRSFNRRAKRIAWVHCDLNTLNWPVNKGVFYNQVDQIKAYTKFGQIICISEIVKKTMLEMDSSYQAVCIYNPIDVERLLSLSKEECGFSWAYTWLSVGRLEPVKGFVRLINVIERLVREGFYPRLLIIGEGSERDYLKSLIIKKGLNDNIKLLGFVENPFPFFIKTQLYICSSVSEGFSLTILEAQSLEIPVLSTDCGGPRELLLDGRYGILVDNSEDGLYYGLKRVLLDGIDIPCKEIQQRINQKYGIDLFINRVKQIIEN